MPFDFSSRGTSKDPFGICEESYNLSYQRSPGWSFAAARVQYWGKGLYDGGLPNKSRHGTLSDRHGDDERGESKSHNDWRYEEKGPWLMLHPGSDLFSCWCGWVVTMNVLFKETVSTSFVLTRGELLCPLIHWDPVIHYCPLGQARRKKASKPSNRLGPQAGLGPQDNDWLWIKCNDKLWAPGPAQCVGEALWWRS